MKVAISEIKNNIPGPTVERRKVRIKSMIWNIMKKKTLNQNIKKKKEYKKQGWPKKLLGQLQTYQHLNHRGARRGRGRARN